jgi:PAS domain S-box-containing protein
MWIGGEKIRKFQSLTVTLTVTFFTLSAVTLTAIGALTLYVDLTAQRRIIAEHQRFVAYEAAQTVGSFVQEKFSILEKAVSLSDLIVVDQETQEVVLERLLGKEPSFRQLVLFNDQGEELVRASRLSKLLSGQLIHYEKSELFSMVSQKEAYISPVYIDEITSEPMVVMAVAATDIFGDFEGTLLAEVNLKFMWDLVEKIKIGEAGLAYVVDEEGDLIAFGDTSRVLKGENLIHLKEVDEFVKGDEAIHTTTANISKGIQDAYVVANHEHLGKPDWAVIVELPLLEVYQPVINRIVFSGLIILSTLGLTTGAVIYLSKKITEPIINLRNAAVELGKGKLDTKIQVDTRNEIGELAATFSQMAETIAKSQERLEEQVKERTKKLEGAKVQLEDRQAALMNALEDAREFEGKLKEERDRINLIISSMGEGLLVVDPNYKILMVNSAAETFLDLKDKDVIGKRWDEVTKAHEGKREIPLEERVSFKVLKTGVTIITELKHDHYYSTPDGKKFPIISVTTPILTDGKVTASVKVFRDATTERKAKDILEGKVKIEQTRSQSMLENIGEGIVLTNEQGLVEYVNPAFTEMAGYTTKDLSGRDYSASIEAFDLKENPIPPKLRSDAAAVTAKRRETRIFLQKKDGKKLAVIINTAPVKVDNEFIGVVRVIHDYSADLQLQRQKDDFFSIASHELRTPLTVISGNMNILSSTLKAKLASEELQLMKDTEEATDRLIKMVSDFLNVSRLDQGRIEAKIVPLDSCKVTEKVINELRILAERKGLKLNYICRKGHGKVMADEGFLKETLINLIGNSIKFTEKGEITVEHSKKNRMLKTTVTDTGIGISKENQKLLFQRFQQAMERTLAREAGGTGLGLYISREFIKIMKGNLILEKSERGKGSTFSFTLPLAKDSNKKEGLAKDRKDDVKSKKKLTT